MEMVKSSFWLVTLASCAWGADFSLAIGNPIAVGVPAQGNVVKKDVGMAVRAEGCADPAKVQIVGTAEGIVNGARRSVPLRILPATTAGASLDIRNRGVEPGIDACQRRAGGP